jgi:hypothetical protein
MLAAATGLAAVLAEAGAQGRYAAADERTITRTLRFSGAGDRTLDVRLVNGSIRVSGEDGPDVQVEARRRVRAESQADLAAAEREVRLDFVEETDRVGAAVAENGRPVCGEPQDRSRDGWRRRPYEVTFDLAIRVPRGTRLRLCTINGGEIHVAGTAGDFEITNVNGRITMEGIGGSGAAETVNGTVSVSFRDAPRAASRFKTVNGDVEVIVPDGLAADLAMKTFNGGLFTDFDVQPLPGTAAAVERRGGLSVYRSSDFTRVRAGGGGPQLTFETFNGDVRLIRASRRGTP